MEKLIELLTYAVSLVLYLDLWARKCCIVINILKVNAILIVQRRIERRSHRSFSIKKVLLQISQSSQENTCAKSLFFKRLYYRFFPVDFPKFVGQFFLQNTFGWLLLYLEPCQVSIIEAFCGNSKSLTVFIKQPIIYV